MCYLLAVNMDHGNHDCILVAVLSHGEMGIIYAKDTPYKPDFLWSSFTADKCPTLAGKCLCIYLLQLFINNFHFRKAKNVLHASLPRR